MVKIRCKLDSLQYKISELNYKINLEKEYNRHTLEVVKEKERDYLEYMNLQMDAKLFEHKLRAYGKHEFYYHERETKKAEFLEKHEDNIRFYRQKHARKKAWTKDKRALKYLDIKLQDDLIKLGIDKTKYFDNVDFTYTNLIKANVPDVEYQDEYLRLTREAQARLDSEVDDYREILKLKTERQIYYSKLRIMKLEELRDLYLDELEELTMTYRYLDSNELLKVEDLTLDFGGLRAIDNISFVVKEKEIFGLVGKNGAGKTAILNTLTRYYRNNRGNIYFKNKYDAEINLSQIRNHNLIYHGIAQTFQNRRILWDMTVHENLLVASHSLFRSNLIQQVLRLPFYKKEDYLVNKKINQILEYFKFTEIKDTYPKDLSLFTLKKLELARVLITSPNLLLLDEPTLGLTDSEIKQMSALIKKIKKDFDLTVLFVDHDIKFSLGICDQICILDAGKMVVCDSPKALKTNKYVKDNLLGGK